MSEQNSRLSMDEFLKMNSDYIEHKKACEKKNTKRGIFLGFGIALFAIIIPIIVMSITFDVIITLAISLVGTAIPIYFLASNENKSKQKLEEYGAKLYQEYLKENGFIK